MNIIVEGCDKAGKSTIVSDIRESLFPKIPVVFKISQKPPNDNEEQQRQIVSRYRELFAQTLNPLNKEHVFLFDRSYPSEMVYSFKRGYDAFTNKELNDLDLTLGGSGKTLLVYCEADVETLAKRFKQEKEEYAKESEIEELVKRYQRFLSQTSLPYIRVDSLKDRGSNILAVRKFLGI